MLLTRVLVDETRNRFKSSSLQRYCISTLVLLPGGMAFRFPFCGRHFFVGVHYIGLSRLFTEPGSPVSIEFYGRNKRLFVLLQASDRSVA